MIQSIAFLNVDEGNLCPINVSLYIVLKTSNEMFCALAHRFVKQVKSFDTMILLFLFFNIHFLFCFDSTLFLGRLCCIFSNDVDFII